MADRCVSEFGMHSKCLPDEVVIYQSRKYVGITFEYGMINCLACSAVAMLHVDCMLHGELRKTDGRRARFENLGQCSLVNAGTHSNAG